VGDKPEPAPSSPTLQPPSANANANANEGPSASSSPEPEGEPKTTQAQPSAKEARAAAKAAVDSALVAAEAQLDAPSAGRYKTSMSPQVNNVTAQVKKAATLEGLTSGEWLSRQDAQWLSGYTRVVDRVEAAHRAYNRDFVNNALPAPNLPRPTTAPATGTPNTTQTQAVDSALATLRSALDQQPQNTQDINAAQRALLDALGTDPGEKSTTLRGLGTDLATRIRTALSEADAAAGRGQPPK
jgi:hypothetical protein